MEIAGSLRSKVEILLCERVERISIWHLALLESESGRSASDQHHQFSQNGYECAGCTERRLHALEPC